MPLDNGVVSSDRRIALSLPGIRYCLDAGAQVMVMSHLGRPTEGQYDAAYSLQPVAHRMSELLGRPVPLIKDYLHQDPDIAGGNLVMLENVRFNPGEKANDESLSRRYASLCDIYVMDAFGTAHRAQASTHGVGMVAPVACAGPLLVAELDALAVALDHPQPPVVAIVGGSKVSTKLTVLDSLLKVVDQLIPGGGIANTFIAAAGYNVGKSLVETELIAEAKRLLAQARSANKEITIPTDVVCATAFSAQAKAVVKAVDAVSDDDMILDIGPQTSAALSRIIAAASTIVWNGPVGVFEIDQFAEGTKALAQAITVSDAFSIAGGGDTLAAIDKYGTSVAYTSTGGGAFLEFLEGKSLPAVVMLKQRYQDHDNNRHT